MAPIPMFPTAITDLESDGSTTEPDPMRFRSPLGWERIHLTGGETWPRASPKPQTCYTKSHSRTFPLFFTSRPRIAWNRTSIGHVAASSSG